MQDSIPQPYYLEHADKWAKFAIGIDPDKDKNGVALWHRPTQKLIKLERLTTPQTVLLCIDYRETGFVYLEAGHLIKHIWGLDPKWSSAKKASVARDKGVNHGFGLSIKQWLEHYMIAHAEVLPEKKWTPEYFKMISGWETKDQELIDAGRMVVGR
ncbi:hypothetical protein GCM10028807_54690 [Spirosoma daeguense]